MVLDAPMSAAPANAAAPPRGGGGLAGALPGLLAVLQNHPNLPASFLTSIIGNFGALTEQRKAQQLANRQNFSSTLSSLAMQPGMTPEMLQAQASTIAPNIAGSQYGQSAVSTLGGALGDDTVPPEDIAQIQATVQALSKDDGSTLNDAITQVVQAARLGGAPDAVLEKMKQYVTKLWGDAKGWETFGAEPLPGPTSNMSGVANWVRQQTGGGTAPAPTGPMSGVAQWVGEQNGTQYAPPSGPFSSLTDFIRSQR